MSWHNRYTVTYITWPPIVDFPASGKKKDKLSLLPFRMMMFMFQRNRSVMEKTKLLPTWPINIIFTCSLLSSSSSTSFLELAFFTSGLASSFSASSFTSASSVSLFSATTKHFPKNLEVSAYGVRKKRPSAGIMRLLSQLKPSAVVLNRRVKLLEIIHHLWVHVHVYYMTLHVWNSKYRPIAKSTVALTQRKFKVVYKQQYFFDNKMKHWRTFLGKTITFLKTDSVLVFILNQTSDTFLSLIFLRLNFRDLKNFTKLKSHEKGCCGN